MVTKDDVKYSIEAEWRIRKMIPGIAYILITSIMIFLVLGPYRLMEVFWIFALLVLGIGLPLTLIPYMMYRSMVNRYKHYEKRVVRLEDVKVSYLYKQRVYYTVYIEEPGYGKIPINTKPLWSNSLYSRICVQDYNNKLVDVLYDRTMRRVIVVGLHE
jgi:hypothetical protein